MDSPEKQIQNLRKELEDMENSYYSGNTKASDELYDFKLRQLVELENKHPELQDDNSPTKRVGFYREDNLTDSHEEPMLSLNNAFGKEDMENFFEGCSKNLDNVDYILEPKIDGTSISLIYEDGYLHKALSRGNGEEGEDLTAKILHIPTVPIHIGSLPKKITIRGEIYITKSDFESLKHSDNKVFANHRNFVAGSLRLKKSSELSKKKLRIRTYQILNPEQYGIYEQSEVFRKLKEWGFEVHEEIFTSSNKGEIYEYIEEFGKKKAQMDLPCDGLVIKVNNLRILEDIGFTSKFPKWAIAYKYPSTIKESKLLEIFPTVGRTGKITYTAQIEPVELDGSMVQHATLHNANYIMDLDLRIGDYVSVYKSGEIVPRIIGFSEKRRAPDLIRWIPSENCPSCGSKLITRDNLSTQFCENEDCVEKIHAKLTHWVSKDAADIEGLSSSIVIKFHKIGLIKDIDDIYRIKDKKDFVLSQDLKIKEKLFEKIATAIEKSKDREFRNLLFGLGINFIGEEVASEIAKKFPGIDELMRASLEDLERINGVGKKGASAVIQWFEKEKNRQLIERLRELGLFRNIPREKPEIIQNFLTDKRVVITGRLSRPRSEFVKLLEEKYGAIVCKDINSKVNYLICGEDAGSKLQLAKEKKIEVIGEAKLMEMLNIS